MNSSILYHIAKNIDFEALPVLWKDIDFNKFSEHKSLYPYQREALQNATKIIYKFYDNFIDNETAKKQFLKLNEQNGLNKDLQTRFFTYSDTESTAYNILSEYFEEEDYKLSAWNFINRMSFWMATGSGKSVVLIKLIELLQNLMSNEVLPDNRILFLTHRPDLIEQLQEHIVEFNEYAKKEKGIEFIVRDLREFPEQEMNGNLFKDTQINIYFYRSDLISDIQKENIIDFNNYDNNGKWFVILDEAHKGDSEESKRKQYYNILSRSGFLFNFSATFTDEIDILSTVYNLNLAEYIKQGYGKHLYLFQEQFKNFKTTEDNKDFEEEEKQKIVLMSLIMLAFVKKQAEKIRTEFGAEYFHNPLLLTLVNSVTAKDSDLYLFFRELEKIAKKEVDNTLFANAKSTLQNDLYSVKSAEFEGIELFEDVEIASIKNLTFDEILKYVFNANTSGDFEVRRNPKNKQELSFRVKSGANSEPFALIKIGDIKGFEANNLANYDIEEEFDNVSLFENINDSSVNILMGSRAFYEGWDSNRPNIINFVNIGTHKDAKKFILQSIGRGVRIEPIKNQRKRLLPLINDGVIKNEVLKAKVKEVNLLESLFVFGTNQKAILSVLETLKGEQQEEEHQLSLFEKDIFSHPLLIPVYKNASSNNEKRLKRLRINKEDFALYNDIVETMNEKAIAFNFNLKYEDVAILTEKQKDSKNFKQVEHERIGKVGPVVKHILNYYKNIPEEVDTFSKVEEEIIHYNKISVNTSKTGSETSIEFKRLAELKNKIKKAKNPVDKEQVKNEFKQALANSEIDIDEYTEQIEKLKYEASSGTETFTHRNEEINIKKLLNHYYFPTVISGKDRIKWMKHIIDTPSEIEFVNALEKHLKEDDNFFSQFDWWKFSKIDHSLDKKVRIPYIDPYNGKRNFLPDFVFWLQKENEYHILYIDPKGTGRSEYQFKVDGYRDLFVENEKVKEFEFGDKNLKVHLRLATEDTAILGDKDFYKKYWLEPNNFDIELDE
ncbi:MAG: DEAD/DEAH box helicase family protein [Candidatus Marinimicrobia bacterium]|nr:DEAD/DEAH box helicase family protein [Candidatus Neomarinimicrobiota bacterium]